MLVLLRSALRPRGNGNDSIELRAGRLGIVVDDDDSDMEKRLDKGRLFWE